MHIFYLPCLVIALGILAIRVLGGGEDWYDVWNEGNHHDWLGSSWGNLPLLFSGMVLAVIFFVCTSYSANVPAPSYAESTPIQVSAATSHKAQKKSTHKNKAKARNHNHCQKAVAQK